MGSFNSFKQTKFNFSVSHLNYILNLEDFKKNNNVGMFILLLHLYNEMEYASTKASLPTARGSLNAATSLRLLKSKTTL